MITRYSGSPKEQKRAQRHRRVRSKIHGTSERPRVAIFRSARHIYAQAIDDDARTTLTSASDMGLKSADKKTKSEIAYMVGEQLGKNLSEKNVKTIVFDRGGFRYHGRVKSLAEGIRSAKIDF